jgi:hypothetical protein
LFMAKITEETYRKPKNKDDNDEWLLPKSGYCFIIKSLIGTIGSNILIWNTQIRLWMHYFILFKRRHGQLELYLLSNSTLYLNNIIFCYTILYFKLLLMMLLIGFYGVILFVKQFISWLFVYLQLVFVCV